jgi:hypothetical protein
MAPGRPTVLVNASDWSESRGDFHCLVAVVYCDSAQKSKPPASLQLNQRKTARLQSGRSFRRCSRAKSRGLDGSGDVHLERCVARSCEAAQNGSFCAVRGHARILASSSAWRRSSASRSAPAACSSRVRRAKNSVVLFGKALRRHAVHLSRFQDEPAWFDFLRQVWYIIAVRRSRL